MRMLAMHEYLLLIVDHIGFEVSWGVKMKTSSWLKNHIEEWWVENVQHIDTSSFKVLSKHNVGGVEISNHLQSKKDI